MNLRIAGVVKESIVDGKGLRFVIFCQGCPHNCPGCHNPHTHDFEGGYEAFAELGRKIKEIRGMKLDIMSYSGWTLEQLQEKAEENPAIGDMLSVCDYLVDGPFILAQRDLTLRYRGSKNQRYIDLKKTFRKGEVILASEHEVSERNRYK